MILGLFPELSAPGGIQRSSCLTALALRSFAAARGETSWFVSLKDSAEKRSVTAAGHEIPFTGCGGSKSLFLSHALGLAIRQPSLVVALHPNLAPVAIAMKLLAPGMNTVVVVHGVEVWTPLPFLQRLALQSADRVIAPSQDTFSRTLKEQRVRSAKMRKLAWSLGPEFNECKPLLAPASRPANFPSGRIILTVGRWDASEAYKGVDHLIAAMPVLLKEFPDVQLAAVGEGTDLPRLRALARESGASDHIHFLPFIVHDQLPNAYDACEIFAMPSRGEGFGLVFIEAMARARPAIGGAHGGTPDVIDDGKTGFLVSYGDVNQLVDRLKRLLASERLRREMGVAALDKVKHEFTFTRFSSDLAAILTELCE
ncbi:MAG TPA: glycosyltransferase family 4 protein [Candidatus Acidoferrales bacterium]|nr:glycosyltransferase family 4 protein [Candidatus Acidoferrales bacterium]